MNPSFAFIASAFLFLGLMACDGSAKVDPAMSNELKAAPVPAVNPRAGVRDPAIRPAPLNGKAGIPDDSIRPGPSKVRGGVTDDSVKPVSPTVTPKP